MTDHVIVEREKGDNLTGSLLKIQHFQFLKLRLPLIRNFEALHLFVSCETIPTALFDRTNRGHIDEYMNADIPGGTDVDGGGGGGGGPPCYLNNKKRVGEKNGVF
jgi:hypothetical protein